MKTTTIKSYVRRLVDILKQRLPEEVVCIDDLAQLREFLQSNEDSFPADDGQLIAAAKAWLDSVEQLPWDILSEEFVNEVMFLSLSLYIYIYINMHRKFKHRIKLE